MKTILHYSDGHSRLPKIPLVHRNADTTIILSGDFCDNYTENFTPGYKSGDTFEPTNWDSWNFRKIDIQKEGERQNQWLDEKLIPHFKANGISLEQVIVLKGNHDFCDIESRFPFSLNQGAKTIEYQGVKIGLLTGVLPIVKEWHDEIDETEFKVRLINVDPEIEILITHAPPYGIKDSEHGDHIGSQSLLYAIFAQAIGVPPYFSKLKLHCFGHSHYGHGIETHEIDGRLVKFSNAATDRMILSID